MEYEEKKTLLKNYLLQLASNNLVVAFSGGVDSSLLLFLCQEAVKTKGTKLTAVTMQTRLHPQADLQTARRVAEEAGAEHLVIHLDELNDAGIGMNPVDRCYRCKHYLFSILKETAEKIGASYVIEGTNEDDTHTYRPGIKAINELGILSPLSMFHLTKTDVRRMATEVGLSVASRPSMPCMATRFPYNTPLDYTQMSRVEKAEKWMRNQGFYNVRLRIHGDIARIEVDKKDIDQLVMKREEVVSTLHSLGFIYITLDLEGFRSGSMDIHLKERN